MTTDSNAPDDKDLDRWIAGLAGDAVSSDPLAKKLRNTITNQQQEMEQEIDDLRLRRGRTRLINAIREERATSAPRKLAAPWAIAASVMVTATAGLIGYQLYSTTPAIEAGLIMSYGDLERPRGLFPTVTIDAEDELSSGRAAGQRLMDAGIPFELNRREDGSTDLAVVVTDAADVEILREVLGEPKGEKITDPGYYVIKFE